MITFRFLLVTILMISSSWNEVGRKNAAIKAAAKSYAETDYEASITNHMRLVSEFNLTGPNVNYNLALSQQYGGQPEQAGLTYQSLYSSEDKNIASFAYNQNGVILAGEEKYEEALEAFKMALISNSLNESARYNFELLSRWLQNNPEQEQPQDQQDQDDQEKQEEQEKQDQKSEEKKDGEGEEETKEDEATESEKKDDKTGEKSQEEKESEEASDLESDLSDREKAMEKIKEKLKEMNLSPEQAAQILEAMNAAELRYIQQNKKKPTKKPQRGLPEW